jgi:vitamin-K-epoxide reductase (warfarin-sensitive)
VRILFALIALCGMVVSGLALHVHYSQDTEPCDINERWDCGIVNHSRFAVVHGVPVALIGILGYAALVGLSFTRQSLLLFLGSAAGFVYALSLTRIEAKVIHVWCLYCVISQSIITLLLLLSAVLLALQHWGSKKIPSSA